MPPKHMKPTCEKTSSEEQVASVSEDASFNVNSDNIQNAENVVNSVLSSMGVDTSNPEHNIRSFDVSLGRADLNKERLLALIRAVIMTITSICTIFGFAFDADKAYQVVTTVLMIASIAWGYWNNNNWTKHAVVAQNVLNDMNNNNI